MCLWSDPDARGSTDQLCEVLHPQGALCARAPARPSFRLGHGHRGALVEGQRLRGGTVVSENQVDSSHQHADVAGAADAGELSAPPLPWTGELCVDTCFSVPQVCSEETLDEILQRYLRYNSHARSYTWKHAGTCLDMSRTLSENNIPDDDHELEQVRLDRDLFTPAILLHFNDDLTEG